MTPGGQLEVSSLTKSSPESLPSNAGMSGRFGAGRSPSTVPAFESLLDCHSHNLNIRNRCDPVVQRSAAHNLYLLSHIKTKPFCWLTTLFFELRAIVHNDAYLMSQKDRHDSHRILPGIDDRPVHRLATNCDGWQV